MHMHAHTHTHTLPAKRHFLSTLYNAKDYNSQKHSIKQQQLA